MGNSPTRIAIAYKSGGRRGISPLEYGGLQPILPFLEWRSDAACRVVIFLHDVSQRFLQRRGTPRRYPGATPFPFMPAWGVNVGRIYTPRSSPRNADCRGGVFATRRFPRPQPPHVYHPGPRQSRIIDAPPLIATRRATSLQTPPHHPPTCALPSSYLGRCTLGFWHEIRGCSGPGRRMVGRRWGEGLYCTLP